MIETNWGKVVHNSRCRKNTLRGQMLTILMSDDAGPFLSLSLRRFYFFGFGSAQKLIMVVIRGGEAVDGGLLLM